MTQARPPEDEVTQWLKSRIPVKTVSKIPGDASTRMYFRVEPQQGDSLILMKMESFPELGNDLPFLLMQRHLKSNGVDVPEVKDVDSQAGFILLEDLGDVTLLKRLQSVDHPELERHLYQTVIDHLVLMHHRASPGPNPATFDHEKLMWEIDFTIEHFYEKHLKREITSTDRSVMRTTFSEICTILAAEPTVFTHRDFHSRNVMVKGERMSMIDFQDARLGPAQYDLASLLRDSYYQLEESQIQRLIDYYVARWEAQTGARLDRERFKYVFDLMSVQRNFKAIGSFASFLNRRGNPTYLKYIGNTFENIRRTLLKYPAFAPLREVLFHYYYF